MDNVRPEETEYQYVKSTSGEALGRNVHVRLSECIIKSPHQYYPGYGAAREWKNDAVSGIVYMIQDGDINRNIDTNDILLLLAEWDVEYCMDTT